MIITFFVKPNNRCPVQEFIEKLETQDRAKILACLKNVEELGFDSPRVEFRQIRERLWEMKIKSYSGGFRIFYVGIKYHTLILLHAYQKQSQKAPIKEIATAERRLKEAITHEKNYP
jgi:phage-related protein